MPQSTWVPEPTELVPPGVRVHVEDLSWSMDGASLTPQFLLQAPLEYTSSREGSAMDYYGTEGAPVGQSGRPEAQGGKASQSRAHLVVMRGCLEPGSSPCGHPEDTNMVQYGYGKEASPKHVELGLDPHGRAGRKVQVGQRQHREHHRGHTSSGSASEGSSASSGETVDRQAPLIEGTAWHMET